MDNARIEQCKREFEREFARNERGEHPADFPALPEIAVGRYTRADFYALERERFWTRQWLLAGHVDELPQPGSYKLWERAGWPVLIVRGKDGVIRAFFNVCQHRGGALLRETSGTTRMLACKFHGWTYDLEGRLAFVPGEHDFPGLDRAAKPLHALRCEIWNGFIFVNRDPHAPPLQEALGAIPDELAHFSFEQRRVAAVIPYQLDCNWKVIVDAFQESYHLDATHTQTVAPLLDWRGSTIETWAQGHSVLRVPRRRETLNQDFILDAGSHSADPRHEITRSSNISFTIFPNIIGTAAEYQFPILTFWPTSPNTTEVDILITEPRDGQGFAPEQAQAIIEQFGMVMQEDMSNVAAIQKAYESGALEKIRLGYLERRIYQFHARLDHLLGTAVPPELRVAALAELPL